MNRHLWEKKTKKTYDDSSGLLFTEDDYSLSSDDDERGGKNTETRRNDAEDDGGNQSRSKWSEGPKPLKVPLCHPWTQIYPVWRDMRRREAGKTNQRLIDWPRNWFVASSDPRRSGLLSCILGNFIYISKLSSTSSRLRGRRLDATSIELVR